MEFTYNVMAGTWTSAEGYAVRPIGGGVFDARDPHGVWIGTGDTPGSMLERCEYHHLFSKRLTATNRVLLSFAVGVALLAAAIQVFA